MSNNSRDEMVGRREKVPHQVFPSYQKVIYYDHQIPHGLN